MITSHQLRALSFKAARNNIKSVFHGAHKVHTQSWQGVDISNQPAGQMLELLNVQLHLPQVPRTLENLARDLDGSVNLPWADNHFEERVCGYPLNPGTEWANWPDGQSAAKFLDEKGMFDHNYMERYWPKYSWPPMATKNIDDYEAAERSIPNWMSHLRTGIRFEYGDLGDLVKLLMREPDTRQAYLPLYFPEDVGRSGRKPCTLGYQFILRENQLHIYYPMRSCDFYRHWGDDCYMTVRLGMWILDQLSTRDPETWAGVTVGSFTMHCTSLHMFFNDYLAMMKEQ